MPYATPAAYIARFGQAETVQQLADEEQLLTAQLLQDAIAGTWTGTPSQAEQDAATGALVRLQRALDVQSNYMDGYLRSAVQLPLAAGDANAGALEDCCLSLARWSVADDDDNATERMAKAVEHWRAWLRDIAAGRVHLVAQDGATPASEVRGVRSGQAKSCYDWDSYGGVR